MELNEAKKQHLMLNELLNKPIPLKTLEEIKVSRKELAEVRLLIRFDKDMFAPESRMHLHNDLLEDNPYHFFVNFDRLPKEIPAKIKQLLYRPERMARLNKAYHKVAVRMNIDWQKRVNDKKAWDRKEHRR